ncbi:MAG: adenosylcobalamin-dependent ribonucleoside-diphosphate reductase [SAR202 cluster bacterium]|nr:adenosylcobalamin-dependent ribonucleoside-diphosphate reductase [SAR202 cluster bacterium]
MTTLQLTKNAEIVLKTRYLIGGETPEGLFTRVAKALAQPEADKAHWQEVFLDMMASCQFMPNSPTLFNAGTGQGTLSACFVIPVEDTMSSIMKAATTSAMIQKFGGGIGYSFSKLRPRGSKIATTQGKACGAVAVLKMLSGLSDMITQGGKRHGANMGILSVSHPEILDFIHLKDTNKEAQNFNVSVAITDDFIRAVDQGKDWQLIDPRTKQVVRTLPANQIWNDIIDSAWKTGDPGLYFIDQANRHNPTPHLGNLDSTNPCGEVPLLAHEACNLGSINLAKFVHNGRVDYKGLEDLTRNATRFLDNVVTINMFPVQEVTDAVHATRKIGLGVMGWHDALIKMGIPYDSPQALGVADEVMRLINDTARETSFELARERGSYPACRESIPVRNATRTCIAPTGSISVIAGASSGIEPIFAVAFVKNVLDGKQLTEVNPYFEEIAKERGFYSKELMDEVARTGSVQKIDTVPQDVKALFKTALEIDYQTHVKMQAVFQKHTDLAVSKTINMPNSGTRDDIEQAYRMAFDLGCTGITIYRDGSKPTQVLEVKSSKPVLSAVEGKSADAKPAVVEAGRSSVTLTPRERPAHMTGVTDRVRTGHGNMYVTINFDDSDKAFEVFSTLGKSGGCESASLEAISRLISLALRSGVDPQAIVEQLRGITCVPAWDQGVLVGSPADAVALAMERRITGGLRSGHKQPVAAQLKLETKDPQAPKMLSNGNGHSRHDSKGSGLRCPHCNSGLVFQEGCLACLSCGWNKCE